MVVGSDHESSSYLDYIVPVYYKIKLSVQENIHSFCEKHYHQYRIVQSVVSSSQVL